MLWKTVKTRMPKGDRALRNCRSPGPSLTGVGATEWILLNSQMASVSHVALFSGMEPRAVSSICRCIPVLEEPGRLCVIYGNPFTPHLRHHHAQAYRAGRSTISSSVLGSTAVSSGSYTSSSGVNSSARSFAAPFCRSENRAAVERCCLLQINAAQPSGDVFLEVAQGVTSSIPDRDAGIEPRVGKPASIGSLPILGHGVLRPLELLKLARLPCPRSRRCPP